MLPAPVRVRYPRILVVAVGLLAWSLTSAAAAPITGIVVDAAKLQPVAGASVAAGSAAPVRTGRGGRFRVVGVAPGPVSLRVTADGFEPAELQLDVPDAGLTDVVVVLMRPGEAGEIIEVTDRAPRPPEPPGRQDLRREELTRIPGTRGDALQSLKSLPGVANADAPGSGPGLVVIRGAAPEDSKISIDGIDVPLLYHFFGLTSILPSELIDTIDFYPGGFGAEEGRSTGGVIDVKTRADQLDRIEGFAESSFLNVAGFVHGPLWRRHHLDFTVAARRSTIDLLLPVVLPDSAGLSFTTAPQYYDAQARIDWRPRPSDHAWLFALVSYDLLSLLSENVLPNEPLLAGRFDNEVTFTRLIAGWRREQDRLRARLTTSVGTTGLSVAVGTQRSLDLGLDRIEGRGDLAYDLIRELSLRAGGDGRLAFGSVKGRFPLPPAEGSGGLPNFSTMPAIDYDDHLTNHVAGAYLAADVRPAHRTTISAGVRLDYYDHIGAVTLGPRLDVRQELPADWAVNAAIGSYSRPLEQDESVPTYLEPEQATQYVVGGEHRIGDGITATGSVFYTDRRRLVVRDAAMAAVDPQTSYVNRGWGHSYGAEALLRVKRARMFGWIAYTLSRSERVDDPRSDQRLFDFDQTHNFIAVVSWQWRAWTFGGRWQYTTGTPITPVIGSLFQSDFNVYLPLLGDINSDRLDPSHQLDLRVDRTWKFRTWSLATYLDVTNVYAHPRTLGFRYNFDYSRREAIKELPIVPSLGLRGSF